MGRALWPCWSGALLCPFPQVKTRCFPLWCRDSGLRIRLTQLTLMPQGELRIGWPMS